MHLGRTVFAQLMDFLPLSDFRACVARYDGDYKVRSFSCLDQFLTLAFAQLTHRDSLRDIETSLRAVPSKLYHMGFRGAIARWTRPPSICACRSFRGPRFANTKARSNCTRCSTRVGVFPPWWRSRPDASTRSTSSTRSSWSRARSTSWIVGTPTSPACTRLLRLARSS